MEEQSNPSIQEDAAILYAWQALEFSRTNNRSSGWYIAVGVAWLALVAYGVYIQDWLRTAVAVLLGVVVWLVVKMKPREFKHEITGAGFKVAGKLYPFSRFRAFGILKTPEGYRLIVVPAQRLGQGLSLQLGGADVEIVRTTVVRFLPEEEQQEDLVDRMNRLFRL
jgi:hypothetical protein